MIFDSKLECSGGKNCRFYTKLVQDNENTLKTVMGEVFLSAVMIVYVRVINFLRFFTEISELSLNQGKSEFSVKHFSNHK